MDALETALAGRDPGERLVLVVDQFEEVFTATADESERAAFIERLVALADDPADAVVVIAIRADYTGHFAAYPELSRLFAANLVLVGPMTRDELRRAIELPARRVGVRVEIGPERRPRRRGRGGARRAAAALHRAGRALAGAEDGWLRVEGYERTGGVRGAVARLAEASYEQLSRRSGRRRRGCSFACRRGRGGCRPSAVASRSPSSTSIATPWPRRALEAHRGPPLTRDDGMIEVAHEALIREWPRLRAWLEEDVTGRQLRGHLTQSAKQWAERDRDAGELYRGARLSATLDWAARPRSRAERARARVPGPSRQASEPEAERKGGSNGRLRGLLVGALALPPRRAPGRSARSDPAR